jgi:myo-inositol-1(or 4)-monophosphatase
MDFEKITKQVIDISKRAGQIIKEEVSGFTESDVEYKGSHDLVSYVDKKSEAFLVNELKKVVPEAGFIAEESPELKKAERFNWIIDPLDGTTNFIHKIPVFSVSIALAEFQKPVVGVIFEINLNECFYAWKDSPAYLNGKEIKVSDTKILDQALIATGFPYYDYSRLDAYLVLFKELMQSSRGVRRLGSAAVDLAYVACGRFELFYEYGLNPWDVAAGALIVERAGGKITTFNGDDNFIFGKEIVASNAKVHDEFMTKVKTFFS